MSKHIITFDIEKRSEQNVNDCILEGYAIKYESPTVLFKDDKGPVYEVIKRGALDKADTSDVILSFNHDDSVLLARTSNGSLHLEDRAEGLYIRANVTNSPKGKEVYDMVSSGLLSKMSFSFTIADAKFDRSSRTREIRSIDKLYDVSVVTFPAYDDTSVVALRKSIKDEEKKLLRKQELLDKFFKEDK